MTRQTPPTEKPKRNASVKPTSAPAHVPPTPANAPEKEALGWAHSARFLTTAAQLHHLPTTELPEVAFVGRSNAGKSTAVNTIAQQRQLAFASKTPGRTQHINLFSVGPRGAPNQIWADLPGYGYAAVEREAKLRWQKVMADYLDVRRNLVGVVHMIDSRHGFTELDLQLLEFVKRRIRSGEVKLLVVLTKCDKLNRKEAAESLRNAEAQLADVVTDESDVGIVLFSALKKVGVGDVAVALKEWAASPEEAERQAASLLPPSAAEE